MSDQPKEPVQNNHKKHLILAITVSIIVGGGIAVGVIFALSNDQNKGIPSLVNCDAENQSPNCVPVPIQQVEKMNKENFDRCVELEIAIVKAIPFVDDNSLTSSEKKILADDWVEYDLLDCKSVEQLITETYDWQHRND